MAFDSAPVKSAEVKMIFHSTKVLSTYIMPGHFSVKLFRKCLITTMYQYQCFCGRVYSLLLIILRTG